MKSSVIALLVITSLAITGCVSDTSTANSDEITTTIADDSDLINQSVKDEIIDQESDRVRRMLSNESYEDYSIGGMDSFEVKVVNEASDRVIVEVSIPYSYTYNKHPSASDSTKTVTPVSVTVDEVETSQYSVTEDRISKIK